MTRDWKVSLAIRFLGERLQARVSDGRIKNGREARKRDGAAREGKKEVGPRAAEAGERPASALARRPLRAVSRATASPALRRPRASWPRRRSRSGSAQVRSWPRP